MVDADADQLESTHDTPVLQPSGGGGGGPDGGFSPGGELCGEVVDWVEDQKD